VVGGKGAIAQLQELGVRSDGSATPYAMGLILDQYRGLPRVQHTGEWVGYRASVLRFPRQRLGVIVLCNMVGDLDPLALSERVADVYLGRSGRSAPEERARFAAPTAAEIAGYAGTYWNAETFAYLRFAAGAGTLVLDSGESPQRLIAIGPAEFQGGNSSVRYAFHRVGNRFTVDAQTDDSDPVVLQRMPPGPLQEADLAQYVGVYYSAELGVSWTLKLRGTRLMRSQWMFPAQELQVILPDTFTGDLSEGSYALEFTRNEAGRVDGFTVATSMLRPLHFSRCEAAPPGSGPLALGCRAAVDGTP
jgi:hypothetical protein